MIKKALINTSKYVPDYFSNNREFQVFLRAVNVALSVIKSDIDQFIPNLLDPLRCKSRLLPLLSSYVGFEYDPTEKVLTNRWITRLYPLLIRNRGNEIGITLAVSMSICLMADPDELNLDRNFSIDVDTTYDKWGRPSKTIKIYVYHQAYLSILSKLIEVVRPAGMRIEMIPAHSIDGTTETIVLTDEYSFMKYDYITGKLLSINDVDIHIQNSWPILIDEQAYKQYRWMDLEVPPDKSDSDRPLPDNNNKIGRLDEFLDAYHPITWKDLEKTKWGDLEDTGIEEFGAMPGLSPYNVSNKHIKSAEMTLVDGRFIDKYGNDMNRYIDPTSGKIFFDNGLWNGEIIKETRIYIIDSVTGTETYTGMFFDVSEPAKVLNAYYQILEDGIFDGFYINKNTLIIYNTNNKSSGFQLKEYMMKINNIDTLVWKVYAENTTLKYCWHVDMKTRKFIKDDDGIEISVSNIKKPFSEYSYIGKKAFIMKTNIVTDTWISSSYYLNSYGDIIDNAGNIILSKKDRYKVSDSTLIGFSEVHNLNKKLSTYDGTAIMQREWSFMKDNHIEDSIGRENINDFEEYERVTDARLKFDYGCFSIGKPIREYTGSDLIRFLNSDILSDIKAIDNKIKIPLFVTDFDNENANGELLINIDLPLNFNLGDVFKTMQIRFENKLPNDDLNPQWNIYIDWVANGKNTQYFNLNDLENPIKFIKTGTIEKRTLHWTHKPIQINPKLYDGTTIVYTK